MPGALRQVGALHRCDLYDPLWCSHLHKTQPCGAVGIFQHQLPSDQCIRYDCVERLVERRFLVVERRIETGALGTRKRAECERRIGCTV